MSASHLRKTGTAWKCVWTKPQWIVVALLCSVAFIAYVQRLSISVALRPIQIEFGLDIRQATWLLAAFSWGYAVGQIPCGCLTDNLGVHRTLGMAVVIWSTALGLLSVSHGLAIPWSLWFVVGVAQSCAFSCATRGFNSWLPSHSRARANGGLTGSMSLGGSITTTLTALLLTSISWRAVYLLYAAIGIVWALTFWRLFRDEPVQPLSAEVRPTPDIDSSEGQRPMPAVPAASTAQILCMPAVWALMAQQFFRCAPYVFFASLFPMFLQQHRGMNLRDSGLLSSLPLFGTLLGCLVSGFFADRILGRYRSQLASRRVVAVTGLSITVTSIFAALWLTDTFLGTFVMCLGTFGSAFAGVAAFTAAIDIGRDRVGTVFGLMNTSGNVAGAISPIVMGEIIARSGNWNIIVALCSGLYLVAAASWMILGSLELSPRVERMDATVPSVEPLQKAVTI